VSVVCAAKGYPGDYKKGEEIFGLDETAKMKDVVVFHAGTRIQDGKVKEERISLGPALGAGFELLSGPAEGTRVISNPPPELAEGYPVRERKVDNE
jgi:hypothetical protein